MNLSELLLSQNNTAAVDQLSRRFGLDRQQTVQAIEALMPAFSQGLKRNSRQPQGAAALIEALAHGQHSRYLDTPEFATSTAGISDGDAILGHLFGNKDVSRNVAAHAAQSTGIGSAILRQMLPVIATMVMGSLFKGATGSSGSGSRSAGGGLLGKIIESLAGGALSGGGSQQPRSQPRTTRRTSQPSLEDLLGQMMGGSRRSAPQRRSEPVMPAPRGNQTGGGSLGDIFDQLAGKRPTARSRPNPYAPKPTRRQTPRRRGTLEEIFGDMLEPGGNSGAEYQRQTGSVFDEFLGPSR